MTATIPRGAIFEAELSDDVALYSVEKKLRHGNGTTHPDRRYNTRPMEVISRIIVHKSGADGPPGYLGAVGCARYVVNHRNWPGAPYTFWAPREPDVDDRDRLVLYRLWHDEVQCYHTGGLLNRYGVSIAFQGNYDGDGDLIAAREPTAEQYQIGEAFLPWASERYRIDLGCGGPDDDWGLTGHWEHGKPVCPGDALVAWIRTKRGEPAPIARPADLDKSPIDPRGFDVAQLQRALALLGHDPGPVDGIRGYRTRRALEAFQRAAAVVVDGWYGPQTATALHLALVAKGHTRPSLFAA